MADICARGSEATASDRDYGLPMTRVERLIAGLPLGYYRATRAGRLLEVNEKLASWLGYSDPGQMVDSVTAFDLYADPSAYAAVLEEITTTGQVSAREVELKCRDGSTRWFRQHSHAVVDDEGGSDYDEGFLEDISRERRARNDLETSDRRFREAFDHAPIGMAIIAPDGTLIQVNQALAEFLGYEIAEITGRSWMSLTHPEDIESNRRQAQEIFSGRVAVQRVEKRYLHKDGTDVWALMNATTVRGADGTVEYLIGQVVDLTDRKRAEEALEEIIRSKNEFVASVSHELRTPLTVVHGLAAELRDLWPSFSPREASELVGLVADQSAEVTHLVEDLLVSARSEAGTLSVEPAKVAVRHEIDTVLESLGRPFDGNLTWIDDGTDVVADPTRLRQIVRNLVTNALRYGGSHVTISISSEGGMASILVKDDGEGIPDEDRERIFEPYARAHDGKGRPASVGLGLTVSRDLARLMGGNLVYRFADGASVFELTLPAA